jgi:hypothetical protein
LENCGAGALACSIKGTAFGRLFHLKEQEYWDVTDKFTLNESLA